MQFEIASGWPVVIDHAGSDRGRGLEHSKICDMDAGSDTVTCMIA